jgi:hypothetical protein
MEDGGNEVIILEINKFLTGFTGSTGYDFCGKSCKSCLKKS